MKNFKGAPDFHPISGHLRVGAFLNATLHAIHRFHLAVRVIVADASSVWLRDEMKRFLRDYWDDKVDFKLASTAHGSSPIIHKIKVGEDC